jgi:hypothetical protein
MDKRKMKKVFLTFLVVLGAAGLIAGCASLEEAPAPEPKAAAAPPAETGYGSSRLIGKWLSFSTGFIDELVLSNDGTGTTTLYNGSGAAEKTERLTFEPDTGFFNTDPLGVGLTIPVKYSLSEDGKRLTVDMPYEEGKVYTREEDLIREVSAGENLTSILRLGNYYSVAGSANCVPLFTEAVKRGSSDGNLNLGNYYYKADKGKAFEYYMAAAEQGNPQGEFNVSVFYLKGEGGMTMDVEKGLYWLMLAAEHGSADALNVLLQLAEAS